MLPPADNSVGDQRPKSASGPSGHLRRVGSQGAIRQLKAAPVDSAGREPVLPRVWRSGGVSETGCFFLRWRWSWRSSRPVGFAETPDEHRKDESEAVKSAKGSRASEPGKAVTRLITELGVARIGRAHSRYHARRGR
jgi:hypothetical protein